MYVFNPYTVIQENGKEKCHRYFPDDEVNSTYVQFEQVRMTCITF